MSETMPRADCEPTEAPTPVPDGYIRRNAPAEAKSTVIQGARNAVAEWIAEDPDIMVSQGDVMYVDDDVVIVIGTDDWPVCRSETSADPRIVSEVIQPAHNAYARKHGVQTSANHMLVIDRSLVSDHIDLEE